MSFVARTLIDRTWDEEIVPLLADYVRIPAKSPDFDPDWASHGHIDQAVAMFVGWAEAKLALAPFQTRNRQPHQIKDQREENDPSGQAIKLECAINTRIA